MEGDDKGPEIGRENEKIADLLGVDWSQLMEQQVTVFCLQYFDIFRGKSYILTLLYF